MGARALPSPTASVVLLYHQIGTPESDPFRQFVSAENFARQMEVVSRCRPVALTALAGEVRAGHVAPGGVAVTFDDGFLSNLRLGKPAMERAGVPGTVFVATAMTGAARDFWWTELAAALLGAGDTPGELRLTVDGEERGWQLGAQARTDVLFEVWAWLRVRTTDQAQSAVSQVRAWAGTGAPKAPGDDARTMTIGELRELAHGGLITIGAHTRTHPLLAARTPAEQREEIGGSRRELEEWLGDPVTTFAYPFGGRVTEYRAPAVRAVRELGFECAVAVAAAPVTAASPVLELPRHVVPDIPGDAFETWLAERLAPDPRATTVPSPAARVLRALRERLAPPGRL